MKEKHPKVLFITPLAFNDFTGGGVTFSNLFRGWPKNKLFCLHNDNLPLTYDVCENYYKLSPHDYQHYWPFNLLFKLWGKAKKNIDDSHSQTQGKSDEKKQIGIIGKAKEAILKLLFSSDGVPVKLKLTQNTKEWIKHNKPDVVYTILGNIWVMELVEYVRTYHNVPIIVHIMDDIVNDRYKAGLYNMFFRKKFISLFNQSINKATLHLSICDMMSEHYQKRYNKQFYSFQNTVDIDAFSKIPDKSLVDSAEFRVLYAGSLYPNVQLSSLFDIARAIEDLRLSGFLIRLDLMCPDFMIAAYKEKFESFDGVSVVKQTKREDYFQTLSSYQLLLLPVNFEKQAIRFIKYSMPTKVPEYLMSNVPILLYGPKNIAQIEYARTYGWGVVVDEDNREKLQDIIKNTVLNQELKSTLIEKAKKTACSNHDQNKVVKRFQDKILEAVELHKF